MSNPLEVPEVHCTEETVQSHIKSEVLTVDGLAARLKVGPATVRRMVQSSAIPHFRVGKSLRFDYSEVLDYFKKESSLSQTSPVELPQQG